MLATCTACTAWWARMNNRFTSLRAYKAGSVPDARDLLASQRPLSPPPTQLDSECSGWGYMTRIQQLLFIWQHYRCATGNELWNGAMFCVLCVLWCAVLCVMCHNIVLYMSSVCTNMCVHTHTHTLLHSSCNMPSIDQNASPWRKASIAVPMYSARAVFVCSWHLLNHPWTEFCWQLQLLL